MPCCGSAFGANCLSRLLALTVRPYITEVTACVSDEVVNVVQSPGVQVGSLLDFASKPEAEKSAAPTTISAAVTANRLWRSAELGKETRTGWIRWLEFRFPPCRGWRSGGLGLQAGGDVLRRSRPSAWGRSASRSAESAKRGSLPGTR